MLFPVVYAVLFWYLAFRYRRRVWGFFVLSLGLLGLATIAWLHLMLNRWTDGAVFFVVLQAVFYPYIAVFAAVAMMLLFMPPTRPLIHCKNCFYDLEGLDPDEIELCCPECGGPVEIPIEEHIELIGLPDPMTVPSQRLKMARRQAEQARRTALRPVVKVPAGKVTPRVAG